MRDRQWLGGVPAAIARQQEPDQAALADDDPPAVEDVIIRQRAQLSATLTILNGRLHTLRTRAVIGLRASLITKNPSTEAASTKPRLETLRPPWLTRRPRAAAARLDDGHRGVPAQRGLDILAANPLGHALYSPVSPASGDQRRPANLARFIFLNDQSARFYRDWDGIAHAAVGSLRAETGRAPYDRALTSLVGELSVRSQPFREQWAAHDAEY